MSNTYPKENPAEDTYSGRVSRSAYWFFTLTWILYGVVIGLIGRIYELELMPFIGTILTIASLNMTIRRLHDIDRSGWFQLISLIPVVGLLMLLWYLAQPSDAGQNRYGAPQPHRISKLYLVLSYLFLFAVATMMILVIGNSAEYPGKYVVMLITLLGFSYLLTRSYTRMFHHPFMRTLILVKRYLALSYVFLTISTLVVLHFYGQNDYDFIANLFTSALFHVAIGLGIFALTYTESALLAPLRLRWKFPVIALITLTLLTVELTTGKDLDALMETPQDQLGIVDRLNTLKYLAALSMAEHDSLYGYAYEGSLQVRNFRFAEFFLQDGADVNISNRDSSYLVTFIVQKEWEWAELFLRYGADLNQKNDEDNSVLNAILSEQQTDPKIIEWLATHGAVADKTTPRYVLAYADNAVTKAVVKYFPKFTALYDESVESLQYADGVPSSSVDTKQTTTAETINKLRKILKNNNQDESDIVEIFEADLNTHLADAILADEKEKIEAIMKHDDLDLTSLEAEVWSPLMSAAETGNLTVATQLLERGAEVNHTGSNDRTALARAIFSNHPEMVALLCSHGASLTVSGPSIDVPLIIAEEKPELIKILLEAGADPNVKNSYRGNTVLHTAAMSGDIDIAKMMFEAKADANTRNRWDATPLLTAIEKKHADMVELLLANGAKIEVTLPYDDSTPLINAVKAGNTEIIRILVLAGANIDKADKYGNTPLSLAKTSEIIKLLQIK